MKKTEYQEGPKARKEIRACYDYALSGTEVYWCEEDKEERCKRQGLGRFTTATSLPLTNAVDAIETVENLYFDVALVSNQMPPALPELLFQSHRGIWLEIILLKIPKQHYLVDIADFVLAVNESVSDGRIMSHQMEEVWHTARYGERGEPRTTFLAEWAEGEWAKFEGLERMFAASRNS